MRKPDEVLTKTKNLFSFVGTILPKQYRNMIAQAQTLAQVTFHSAWQASSDFACQIFGKRRLCKRCQGPAIATGYATRSFQDVGGTKTSRSRHGFVTPVAVGPADSQWRERTESVGITSLGVGTCENTNKKQRFTGLFLHFWMGKWGGEQMGVYQI